MRYSYQDHYHCLYYHGFVVYLIILLSHFMLSCIDQIAFDCAYHLSAFADTEVKHVNRIIKLQDCLATSNKLQEAICFTCGSFSF